MSKCLFILPSEKCVKNNRYEDIYDTKNGKLLEDLCKHWNKDKHEIYNFEVIFSNNSRVNEILGDPIEKNFAQILSFEPPKGLELIILFVPYDDFSLGPEAHYEPFKRSITWEWSADLGTYTEACKKKKKDGSPGVSIIHLSFESLKRVFKQIEDREVIFNSFLFFQLHPSDNKEYSTLSEFIFRSFGSSLLRIFGKKGKNRDEVKEVKEVLKGLDNGTVERIISPCWKELDCFDKEKIGKAVKALGFTFEDNSDDDDTNIETLKTSLEGKKETETNLFGALNDFRCGSTFDEKGENLAHVNILFFLDRVLYMVKERFRDDKSIGFGTCGDVEIMSSKLKLLIESRLNEKVKKNPDYCVYEKNMKLLLYLGEFKYDGSISDFRIDFYECLFLANESLKKIIQKIYFEKKERKKEDYEIPFGIPILLCDVGETRKWVLLSYCIRIKEHQREKVKISGAKIKFLGKGDDFHQSDELARLLVKSKKALEEAVIFIKDRCQVKENYSKRVLVDECYDGALLQTIGTNTSQNKIKGMFENGRDGMVKQIRESDTFDDFYPREEIFRGVFVGAIKGEKGDFVLKVFKSESEFHLVNSLQNYLDYVYVVKRRYMIMKKLVHVRCKSLGDLELLMLDIVDFVKIIHPKKVLHLDIRPANIMMIASNQRYQLIDFHISIQMPLQDNDVSNENCGYHEIFSPPEQKGKKKIEGGRLGYHSDYFSLGKSLMYFKNRIPDLNEQDLEYSEFLNNMTNKDNVAERKKGFDGLCEMLNRKRENLEKTREKKEENNGGNGGGKMNEDDDEEEEEEEEEEEGEDSVDDKKSKSNEVETDSKKNNNMNNHPIVCFLKSNEEDLKECLLFGVYLNERVCVCVCV